MSTVTGASTIHPATTPDPAGEPASDLNRYGWALRRSLPVIVAVSVVCGLLAMFGIGSSLFTDSSRLSLEDANETLASVGLDTAFEEIPPLFAVRNFLNNENLTRDLPGDATASAVSDTTNSDVLILTISATSGEARDEAADLVFASADQFIAERRAAAAADLLDVITQQRESTVARLAELDTEIAQLPDGEVLRDAYLDERAELNSNQLLLDGQERALAAYTGSGNRLLVFESATAETDTRITWFVIGFILGALGSAAVVLVWAHLDRRVRNRAELRFLTPGVALPALPREGPERAPALAAIASMSARLGHGQLLVVPADDRAARGVSATIADTLGDAAALFSPRTDDPGRADGARAIVVAAAGTTHADDVVRTCSYLDALNCEIVGAVLGDIKTSQLRRVAS